MVRTFLKVYMELGFYFLFLQEQIKDIIIILMHELGHVVYADCECLFSMKIYTTLLRDSMIAGELFALAQTQATCRLFTGLEFTAYRVMFKTSE